MKKPKLFAAFSVVLLMIAGSLASKTVKRRDAFTTAVIPGLVSIQVIGVHVFSTQKISANYCTAYFKTTSGSLQTIMATYSLIDAKKAYFK